MRGKRAEFCHSWLCCSGRNFLQRASCIVRHSCEIHHEIERKITAEEGCLSVIFEKRASIAEAVYGKQSCGYLHLYYYEIIEPLKLHCGSRHQSFYKTNAKVC